MDNRHEVLKWFDAVPKGWNLHRAKVALREIDQRSSTGTEQLLSLSKERGIVPRSEYGDAVGRADTLVGYKIVQPNQLVMNKMQAWNGMFGLSHLTGIVSPEYCVFVTRNGFDERFLSYQLRSRFYVGQFGWRSRGMGTAFLRLHPENLLDTPLLLPSLEQQRAIADYLDSETERIDALIEKKRRMAGLLEERFTAAIFQAITRGVSGDKPLQTSGLSWVDEIPVDWGTPPVSANFELQLGKMLNAEAAVGIEQHPYLRNVNVQWDSFDYTGLASMHFDASDRKRCDLRSGDLLVCEGGEVGRAAVWTGELKDCYFQKAIHRVRPRGGANSRYLMYCLWAAAKRSVFSVEGNLSTIVHLTGEQLRVHRFPWPSSTEQAKIVSHLDRVSDVTRRAVASLTSQCELLLEHRQALVTAVLTGELDIPGLAA